MANFNLQDYETVDSRIKRFYKDHPNGAITTQLVDFQGDPGATRWIVKASVWRDRVVLLGESQNPEVGPDGTGYAFELDGKGMANQTSALENCETSAIGRALANIGYSGDKRASREEMKKATAPAEAATVTPPEGWADRIAAVVTLDGLQKLYEDEARLWWTDDVKAAFSARKAALMKEVSK